jgi:putative transposase
MTQYPVTLHAQTLHRRFCRDHHLAPLLESILTHVLDAQVSEHAQAQRYDRTDERQGDWNG